MVSAGNEEILLNDVKKSANMICGSVKMTWMSYVDNSVEIGDFFSENVKTGKASVIFRWFQSKKDGKTVLGWSMRGGEKSGRKGGIILGDM